LHHCHTIQWKQVNRCSQEKWTLKWYVCTVSKIRTTYTLVAQTKPHLTLSPTASACEQHSLFPVQLQRHENSMPTCTTYDKAIVQAISTVHNNSTDKKSPGQLYHYSSATHRCDILFHFLSQNWHKCKPSIMMYIIN